jgi:hypothetical protein
MDCNDCVKIGIPKRLCTSNKPKIDFVDNTEELYRRHDFTGTEVELKERIDIFDRLFKIHDDSYNRSSLSIAQDVLLNDNPDLEADIYSKCGIIKLLIDKLQKKAIHQINNDPRVFTLVPIHDPKDCNYSHCEIHCYVDGIKATKKPKSINTVFRLILIDMMELVKEAS